VIKNENTLYIQNPKRTLLPLFSVGFFVTIFAIREEKRRKGFYPRGCLYLLTSKGLFPWGLVYYSATRAEILPFHGVHATFS
jgi:hypothetical protein